MLDGKYVINVALNNKVDDLQRIIEENLVSCHTVNILLMTVRPQVVQIITQHNGDMQMKSLDRSFQTSKQLHNVSSRQA